MHIKTKISIEYNNKKHAQTILDSLNPENKGYLESEINDSKITFKIDNNSLKTTLSTIDDLIFCEIISTNIIKNNKLIKKG